MPDKPECIRCHISGPYYPHVIILAGIIYFPIAGFTQESQGIIIRIIFKEITVVCSFYILESGCFNFFSLFKMDGSLVVTAAGYEFYAVYSQNLV